MDYVKGTAHVNMHQPFPFSLVAYMVPPNCNIYRQISFMFQCKHVICACVFSIVTCFLVMFGGKTH